MTPQAVPSPVVGKRQWQQQQRENFISTCHADWWSRGGGRMEGGKIIKTWQSCPHAKASLSPKEPNLASGSCSPFLRHRKRCIHFFLPVVTFELGGLGFTLLKFTLQQMGLSEHQAQAKKSAAGHRCFLGEREKDRSRLPSALG